MKKLKRPKDRMEWLKARQSSIGGSDIGAIAGLSPWRTPLQVYYEKTQDPEYIEPTLAQELGTYLEPFIREKFQKWYLENYGIQIKIQGIGDCIQDKTVDYFTVTPDGYFAYDNTFEGLECKTTTEYRKDEWDEDKVPDSYYAQCQWTMGITEWPKMHLAVVIGNRLFKVIEIEKNDKIIKGLREIAHKFWQENVLKKNPPMATGADDDILDALWPQETPGKTAEIDPEELVAIEKLTEEYDSIQERIKELAEKKADLQAKLKSYIKDAEILELPDRKITYKTTDRKAYTVPAKAYRVLRIGKKRKGGDNG